jgi:hypothetical protein
MDFYVSREEVCLPVESDDSQDVKDVYQSLLAKKGSLK